MKEQSVSIRCHAERQTATLLRRMADQAGRAASSDDADTVHDLRVSIRRFSQALRIFRQFFPHGAAKKIRRRLKRLMAAASEVRNRDIALELLEQAGEPRNERLVEERRRAGKDLRAALKRWSRRNTQQRWRARLGV
ncbi:MAG: CHAD domain-containing protein [Acidobacteriota bacterium]